MIYIECKPDHVLVDALTEFPRKEIVHEFKGKFEVCKRLETSKNSKGLVDEDPSSIQPSYLSRMILEADLVEHNIKVLHDNSKNRNYILDKGKPPSGRIGACGKNWAQSLLVLGSRLSFLFLACRLKKCQ